MVNIPGILTALSGFLPEFLKGDGEQQESLRQQIVGGILPNLIDETLLMALMNAVRQVGNAAAPGDGDIHYRALNRFYVRLTARQKNRFRHVLGTLELTEKFDPDHITESKTEFKDDKKTAEIKKFSRVQVDYEFTADDPRVQFLTNLAKDLLDPSMGATPEGREKAVKAELLALELILKRSHKNILWRHLRHFGKRKLPRHIEWFIGHTGRFAKGADTASLRFVLGNEYDTIRAAGKAAGETPQEIRQELLRQGRSRLPATPAEAQARVSEARRNARSPMMTIAKVVGVIVILYLVLEPIIWSAINN
jgi:hypothetical protein